MAAVCAVALTGAQAEAHWCHDLWGTSYNIVVRPAADTVNVPGGSSATLDVYVQNNMGYPLKNFVLTAQATGYTLSVSRQAPKVTGFLMPGESLRHTLTISAASASTLSVQALDFLVNFGDGSQDQLYAGVGKATMVKQQSGAIFPPRVVPGLNQTQGYDQATHLISSAAADYGDLGASLDKLMNEFCTGRGSWDTGGGAPTGTCTPAGATTCPAQVSRGNTKYDWQHLWAAQELVIRKSALGSRTATLRERLKCAWSDTNPAFRWFAAQMLGYLGEDPGARTFLVGLINSTTTSADDKLVAKAALLLFKSAADKTTWGADVTGGLGYTGSTNADYVQMACATTLGIIDTNDAAVNAELIPRAGWVEPDTSDNGKNFVAAHLLNLVAWDRRGWAIEAGDTGAVTFYGSAAPDTVAPRAPATTTCTAQSNGTIRVNWSQVTLDVNSQAENVTGYRVYRGTTARPGAATRPGEQGFDYDHVDPTASIYFDFPALPGTSVHYFTVTALDAAGNASVYGQQVSCTPRYPPVAVISCTPLSGLAPLSVTCGSSGSTDPNGAADLTTRTFELVGVSAPQALSQVTYNFTAASSNLVRLTVTDSTGLSSSATATVVATTAGNTPPTAVA
ncbi:MAG: endo4-beta-xylanase precursor, partial [Myxococcaceae bacterium]|nr:endo4-beta-xylanase precursor [Myxococcaceae bacterium]